MILEIRAGYDSMKLWSLWAYLWPSFGLLEQMTFYWERLDCVLSDKIPHIVILRHAEYFHIIQVATSDEV